MKVDAISLPWGQNTQTAAPPVIDVNAIKAILYLGIRGEIKLQPVTEHTVDTFA